MRRVRRGARRAGFQATEAIESRVMLAGALGEVTSFSKINDTAGNFTTTLDDYDLFGTSLTNLGDLDGDGISELAVGARLDDDGTNRGAVYILSLTGVSQVQIIDNGDAGFSTVEGPLLDDSWFTSNTEGRDGDVEYARNGDGNSVATWEFTGLTPGNYRVSATWSIHPNRATNAPYTIRESVGGTAINVVSVNQELAPDDFSANASLWEDLTIVTITGSTLVVELSNDANGYVIADAIRVEETTTPPLPSGVIIDDGDIHYRQQGDGSAVATWTFIGLLPGTYRVSATWSN